MLYNASVQKTYCDDFLRFRGFPRGQRTQRYALAFSSPLSSKPRLYNAPSVHTVELKRVGVDMLRLEVGRRGQCRVSDNITGKYNYLGSYNRKPSFEKPGRRRQANLAQHCAGTNRAVFRGLLAPSRENLPRSGKGLVRV